MKARFLPLTDVAEILSISSAQAYALVRSGELRALKIGGRGQWRVEDSELEDFIQRMYQRSAEEIGAHQSAQEQSAQEQSVPESHPGAAPDR